MAYVASREERSVLSEQTTTDPSTPSIVTSTPVIIPLVLAETTPTAKRLTAPNVAIERSSIATLAHSKTSHAMSVESVLESVEPV
jgi:hypothetical protein